MNSCYLAPATLVDGAGAVGHYSQATNWSDEGSLQQIFDRVVQSGKKQFQPLRDHLGRPIFQLGPTHAASVKQHLR